ncbi:MAG: hypothetical protein KF861_23970, partial [Planctomycetaceae bacterium]|nr:hypothetical protein [Planctomycetaceae bacterium]
MTDHNGQRSSCDAAQPHPPLPESGGTPLPAQSHPPSGPPSPHTREQLAAQARIAAEQAVQLARLAEESARLALQLNKQAFGADYDAPDPHQTIDGALWCGHQDEETSHRSSDIADRGAHVSSSKAEVPAGSWTRSPVDRRSVHRLSQSVAPHPTPVVSVATSRADGRRRRRSSA